jgi:FlaA1/EpsC-like NDP-sugar epimerase
MIENDLVLELLGRENRLFDTDINNNARDLDGAVKSGRFLVIGGAGSIGRAVTAELFKRNPKLLHVVDISENSTVELVRTLRSSSGYISGEFKTFSLDCGGKEFEAMLKAHGPYDYVFNLSALKHVRSERDPFTLMRMIEVNILNTIKTIELCGTSLEKYFCVSTDKAANPVNMMGASKRIMEMFLVEHSKNVNISTARFANVAFSDGSLLDGFKRRFDQSQPLAAPKDIRRYFVTSQEAGELCMMSGLLGHNTDIFFPEHDSLEAITFSSIAKRFLESRGYEPFECESEEQARTDASTLIGQKKWPCYFTDSDTTGEKPCEEFFTATEEVDRERFCNVGVVQNSHAQSDALLTNFIDTINRLRHEAHWNKEQIVALFEEMIPEFKHMETGKYLDQKM